MGAFSDLDTFISEHCNKIYPRKYRDTQKGRITYLLNEHIQGRKPYDLLDPECQEILRLWEAYEESTLSGIGR